MSSIAPTSRTRSAARLAAFWLDCLGVLFLIPYLVGCAIGFHWLVRRGAGVDATFFAVISLVLLAPGIGFLEHAHYIRRSRPWAVTVASNLLMGLLFVAVMVSVVVVVVFTLIQGIVALVLAVALFAMVVGVINLIWLVDDAGDDAGR